MAGGPSDPEASGPRAPQPRSGGARRGARAALPSQSLLLGLNLAALPAGRLGGTRTPARVAAGSVLAQGAYVTGGLLGVQAPPPVWRALLTAPRFVFRRLAGLSRSLGGRGVRMAAHTADAGDNSDEDIPAGILVLAESSPPHSPVASAFRVSAAFERGAREAILARLCVECRRRRSDKDRDRGAPHYDESTKRPTP